MNRLSTFPTRFKAFSKHRQVTLCLLGVGVPVTYLALHTIWGIQSFPLAFKAGSVLFAFWLGVQAALTLTEDYIKFSFQFDYELSREKMKALARRPEMMHVVMLTDAFLQLASPYEAVEVDLSRVISLSVDSVTHPEVLCRAQVLTAPASSFAPTSFLEVQDLNHQKDKTKTHFFCISLFDYTQLRRSLEFMNIAIVGEALPEVKEEEKLLGTL